MVAYVLQSTMTRKKVTSVLIRLIFAQTKKKNVSSIRFVAAFKNYRNIIVTAVPIILKRICNGTTKNATRRR